MRGGKKQGEVEEGIKKEKGEGRGRKGRWEERTERRNNEMN